MNVTQPVAAAYRRSRPAWRALARPTPRPVPQPATPSGAAAEPPSPAPASVWRLPATGDYLAYSIRAPGESDPPVQAGEIVVMRNEFGFSSFVEWLQRLRNGPYGWASHAALVVSSSGDVVEANRNGVIRGDLRNHGHAWRAFLRPAEVADAWDPSGAVAWANECADRHITIDRSTYIAILVRLVFGWQPPLQPRDVPTCAGFVANALERGGLSLDVPAVYATPADLASFFGARDPRGAARPLARAAPCVGPSITIIIPARNEEKTAFVVALEAVAAARELGGRVLVVCDHCSDATAEEAERAGALVLRHDDGAPSKAQAVEAGIRHLGAENDVLGLFDADPTGLTAGHIKDLFEPVLTGQAMQSVGAFDYPFPFGFLVVRVPWSVGERVLAPGVFPVGDPRLRGYALEVVLNERVGELGGTTYSRTMSGCHHRSKLAKAGIYPGLIGNLRMWASIAKASRHISSQEYERYSWNVFLVGAGGVRRVSRPMTALGLLLLKVGRVVFRGLGPFLEPSKATSARRTRRAPWTLSRHLRT